MSDLIGWLLFACLILLILAFLFVVLFMIGAAFWGMWRGVKQLRGKVQVQDKTLPPPT